MKRMRRAFGSDLPGGSGGEGRRRRAVLLSVAALGIAAIVTQLLALRELLDVFAGNELTVGLIAGSWLLLTGIGSLLGRVAPRLRNPLGAIVIAQVGVALLPLLQILAIRHLRLLFTTGSLVGIGEVFWASFLVLLPFCLVSGFLLTAFSGQASRRQGAAQIGEVYVLDTVGSIVGGLLFSFLLVQLFAPLQSASFVAILNLLAAIHLARASGRPRLALLPVAALLATLAVPLTCDLERWSARALYPGLELVHQRSTPYGRLALLRQGDQLSIFQGGVAAGSSDDRTAAEESAHYALAQHPEPRDVLLVSGGLLGAHREIEKYPIRRLDYVELDPAVLELARRFAGAGEDPRTHLIAADARSYLRKARAAYDAILVVLPDPASAQLNRYYTTEFFEEARRALRPGGVLGFGLSGAENYAGPELRRLAAAVYRSVATVFPNVLVIPGARQHFIASDRPLGTDIAARLQTRGIPTTYVRREYLDARLTPERLESARKALAIAAPPNRDFHPSTYLAHLRYWLSRVGSGLLGPLLIALALVALVAILLAAAPRRAVPAALCASGFAGMGLEVVVLIAFQIAHGRLYEQIGVILTGFMVGAAAGAAWSIRSRVAPLRLLLRLDLALAVSGLLFAPLLVFLGEVEGGVARAVVAVAAYPLLTAVVGFTVGGQFPPAARLLFRGVETTAGELYVFDLAGACLGALVISAFAVPLLGIGATCVLLGGVKLVSALALGMSSRMPAAARSARQTVALAPRFTFAVMLLLLFGLGLAIAAEDSAGRVYALSLDPVFTWAVAGVLGVGLWKAFRRRARAGALAEDPGGWQRISEALYRGTRLRLFRWASFLVLGTAVFYPLFRCFFTVPWLFCHVCPRKCIFGYVRPFLIPAALVMNLDRRTWCQGSCPIGTLFDGEARALPRSRRASRLLRFGALGVLVFTVIAYFKVQWDLEAQPEVPGDWYTFFYRNSFAVSAAVIVIAAALILVAARWRRPFCEALCPVGQLSELVGRFEGSLTGRGPGRRPRRRRPSKVIEP